jgi:DNA-binding NarL/FixJ family response regulator
VDVHPVDLEASHSSRIWEETLLLHITPGERSALQLLADGKPANEIAYDLGVSERAVNAQLSALFARMGAATRHDAIAVALRRGLIDTDDLRAAGP